MMQSDPRNWHELRLGNDLQKKAYDVIKRCRLFEILAPFDPAHVSTIANDIAIETSDIDILCVLTARDQLERILKESFSTHRLFQIRRAVKRGLEVVICFFNEELPVEIYAEPIPIERQYGYRHYLAAVRILQIGGEVCRSYIRKLKAQGVKTEPAFARLLGLVGEDPYEEILTVENPDDEWIRKRVQSALLQG